MTKIIGVDFSGAGTDDYVGKTWVTEGQYDGTALTIDRCYPISRKGLEILLIGLPDRAVAAMDFPFGTPLGFAEWWKPGSVEMPDLWQVAANSKFEDFRINVEKFKPNYPYELLRVGDLSTPLAQPCLHMGRPNMVPMTFRGMQTLHRLYQTGRFHIPPLSSPSKSSPVLLEVMPGAALRNYCLPFTKYKDGKTKAEREERRGTRKVILDELTKAFGLGLNLPQHIHQKCVDDAGGDALDSLVAATVAARWAECEADFCVPTSQIVTTLKRKKRHKRQASAQAKGMTEIQAARREGWIYAPKRIDTASGQSTPKS